MAVIVISPEEEHRNRRWLKRKTLLQPSSTTLKKVKSTEPATNESEPGVVKIEQDEYSPPDDSTHDSVDSVPAAPINSFLGFGDGISLGQAGIHGYTPSQKDSVFTGGN